MSFDRDDAALETLFLPIASKTLQWPAEGAMFLRARAGGVLHRLSLPGLVCEQTFKPHADDIRRAGLHLTAVGKDAAAGHAATYPLVLLLPPRQRDEARASMARAVAATAPGGRVMACATNNEGARSAEADLARLVGPLNVMTKNKCRVFWSEPLQGAADPALLQQWLRQDAQRPIADGRFVSRPGVFAWDRVDIASALLANQFPPGLAGRAADLGAGYGYLSARLLAHCPGIESLAVFEAEARALDLARQNLGPFEPGVAIDYHWHDVTTGLPGSYDVIVTNPPFHVQRGVGRPDVGRRFIAVAAAALREGGRLWLVANRHLPYEAELAHNFASLRTVVQEHGFKIVEAIKRQRASARPGSPSPSSSAPRSTGRSRMSPAAGRHR